MAKLLACGAMRPPAAGREPAHSMPRYLSIAAMLLCPGIATAQLSESAEWAAHFGTEYRLFTNITYHRATNFEAKLNVYRPRAASTPNPTLIYFHGGGWLIGSAEHSVLEVLPFLEMGWTVVTVGYRLTHVAPAPAAVEDARCALRWAFENSKQYFIDPTQIVLLGSSAGGLLALTTGMLPPEAGLGRQCLADGPYPVAAILNWSGITDVEDLLEGPNQQNYAVMWLGSQPNREALARRVSPLTYVRAGLPPILSIHGTADDAVPYSHATRLHAALEAPKVPNRLVTIHGGGHGGFSRAQNVMIHATIREFLAQYGLRPTAYAAPGSR